MRIRPATAALVAVLAISVVFASCSSSGPSDPAWETRIPFHYAGDPLADESAVVCFAYDDDHDDAPGALVAFDPETGSQLWTFPLAGRPFERLAEGAVWARDSSDVLHAIDERTGRERWTRPDVAAILDVGDAHVTVVGTDGRLVTLDAATGSVLRSVEVPGLADDRSSARAASGSGRVYLAAGGTLSAADAATGTPLWSVDIGQHSTELAVAGDAVVLNRSDTVECYGGASGRQIWRRAVSYEVEPNVPILSRGVLYSSRLAENEYHPDGGFMRRYDITTGKQIGELATVAFAGDDDVAIVDGVFFQGLGERHYDPVSGFFVNLEYGWRWAESWDSKLVARDAATGEIRWSAGSWSWGFLARPAVVGDRVYTVASSIDDGTPARMLAYRAKGVRTNQ